MQVMMMNDDDDNDDNDLGATRNCWPLTMVPVSPAEAAAAGSVSAILRSLLPILGPLQPNTPTI